MGSAAPCSVSGSRSPSAASITRAPIRSSGSSTRRIGRPLKEASPIKVAVTGIAGDRADRQSAAGAGIAEIERARRLRKTGDADAMNPPQPVRRHAPALRPTRASRRRYAARPRLPGGRRPCSRRPSARLESRHGGRSICLPAPGYGPARGHRGGQSEGSKRQNPRALSLITGPSYHAPARRVIPPC